MDIINLHECKTMILKDFPIIYQQDLENKINFYANRNIFIYLRLIYIFFNAHAKVFKDKILKGLAFRINNEFCMIACMYMYLKYLGYNVGDCTYIMHVLEKGHVWTGSRRINGMITRTGTNWGKLGAFGVYSLALEYRCIIMSFPSDVFLDSEYIAWSVKHNIPLMIRFPKKNFDFSNNAYTAAHWAIIVGEDNSNLFIIDPNKEISIPSSLQEYIIKQSDGMYAVSKDFLFQQLDNKKAYQYVYMQLMPTDIYTKLLQESFLQEFLLHASTSTFDEVVSFIGPKI